MIMVKHRQVFGRVMDIANSKLGRIVVLSGARQVGKTTLVRSARKDYQYLSIEDPVGRDAYMRLTAQQWKQLYPQAALDEVQKSPRLVESIKAHTTVMPMCGIYCWCLRNSCYWRKYMRVWLLDA